MTTQEAKIVGSLRRFLKSKGLESKIDDPGTGTQYLDVFAGGERLGSVTLIEGNGLDICSDWSGSIDPQVSEFVDQMNARMM